MSREQYLRELGELKEQLVTMGEQVERSISMAVTALKDRDLALAQSVVDGDTLINQSHLAIEQACIRLLALQQPLARDLREVTSTLKVITDLERMADHAVDIARVTIRLGGAPLIKPLVDIPKMADLAQLMVREAIMSFVSADSELAVVMTQRDHEVDHLHRRVIEDLHALMAHDPSTVEQGLQLMRVSSFLERIADHATNLGEWVVFVVSGVRLELND